MVSRFPPRPASPRAEIELQEEMRTTGQRAIPRPAAFPTFDRGRSPGSWDRAYRLPVGLAPTVAVDTPARTYRCGGSRGFGDRNLPFSGPPHLFPVSPRRGKRAGTPRTSALIVQHKSLDLARRAGWNLH